MTKIIETPTLETERLILKPITLDHAESLEKHFNNWNVIKHLNDKIIWPIPKGSVAKHIDSVAIPDRLSGKAHLWTIFSKKDLNHPIGRLDYRIERNSQKQGERGFWLAEPYWKKGLMTEAVYALNDYVFEILGRDKMIVQNYADNIGSHRVKEKTGATLIKTKTEKWRGKDRDMEIWELTAENWRKFKANN